MRRSLLPALALFALSGCPQPLAVQFEVDATAAPPRPPLVGVTAGAGRPVAVLVPEVGPPVAFVANELVVTAVDRPSLDAVVARLGAELLATLDPQSAQLDGLAHYGLLKLSAPPIDPDALAAASLRLAERAGAKPTGRYRVTSEEGLRLLGLAASEAEAGTSVAVNWVLEGAAIPTSTQEAPTVDRGLPSDAYQWPHFAAGATQGFGVSEAWSLLHLAGKLGNRVRLAILDSGFSDSPEPVRDLPPVTALSAFPWRSAFGSNLGSCGGGDCGWHGQNVASVAAARVDDLFGGAGTGGPVVEPILFNTTYDYFTASGVVLLARAAGARVINMSFGAGVPTLFAWTVYPFEAATVLVRASGTLLFAAAGNDGANVDSGDCLGALCWEYTWHTPCENDGVICVGGVAWDRTSLDPGSNYGSEHVDLYGPYTVLVGPDPEHPGNTAHLGSGTSFSSPFAAGVAALVWAADPSLPASTVEEAVTRVVWLTPEWYSPELRLLRPDGAVLYVLKAVTSVSLTSPSPATALYADQRFVVEGAVEQRTFRVADETRCELTLSSSVAGTLVTTTRALPESRHRQVARESLVLDAPGLVPGPHVLTLRAACADGELADDATVEVAVTVQNRSPTATIVQPSGPVSVCAGEAVLFRGTGSDPDQPTGLPDSAFAWRSTRLGALGTGAAIVTDRFATRGADTVTLTVTDRYGATGSASVVVSVLPATDPSCSNTPPVAHITFPLNDAVFDVQGPDATDWYVDLTLRGTVSDAQDPPSALTVTWHSDVQGLLGSGAVLSVRLYVRNGATTAHTLTLRVRDSAGNVTEDHVRIFLSVFG